MEENTYGDRPTGDTDRSIEGNGRPPVSDDGYAGTNESPFVPASGLRKGMIVLDSTVTPITLRISGPTSTPGTTTGWKARDL